MKSSKRILVGTWICGLAILAVCGDAVAQWLPPEDTTPNNPSASAARADWEQRVVQSGRATNPGRNPVALTDYRMAARPSQQRPPVKTAYRAAMQGDVVESSGGGEVIPPGQIQAGAMPSDAQYGPAMDPPGPARRSGCASCGANGGSSGYGWDTQGNEGCSDCGDCGDEGDGCWNGCVGHRGLCDGWLFRDMQVFAGAHGFKGPVDQGTSGNFGLFEGLNFGAPLGGPWGWGYQLGFAAAQSNFSGGQVVAEFPTISQDQNDRLAIRSAARHQYFATAGFFKRSPCGGMQWGVVFDLQHDGYYDSTNHAADLKQIRSETSYVFRGGVNEIGYFGAYAISSDEFDLTSLSNKTITIGLKPTDMFALFYRRHFESSGEGRVWAGLSGHGDALVGADFSVPLGQSLGLESRINYLIPKQGHGAGGQFDEAWGLSMNLVWYPGRHATCALNSCYRPVLSVADNANFMVNASPSQVQTPTPPPTTNVQ